MMLFDDAILLLNNAASLFYISCFFCFYDMKINFRIFNLTRPNTLFVYEKLFQNGEIQFDYTVFNFGLASWRLDMKN